MCKAQDELLPTVWVKCRPASQIIGALQEELKVTDKLLGERNRVMEAIPPCPHHGHQCVPHALRWIEKQKGNPDLEELNEQLLAL